MQYIEQLKSLVDEMKQEKKTVDREIKSLPPGRLRVQKREKYLAYICVDENGDKHRMGYNDEAKHIMARKEYLIGKSTALGENIQRCSELCNLLHPTDTESIIRSLGHGLARLPEDKFLKTVGSAAPKPVNSAEVKLRAPVTFLSDMTVEEWATLPYQENTKFLENKKHLGTNGLKYRSRAEMLISTIYEKNDWAYHYDERLRTVDGEWVSPDFQHLLKDGTMLYHEHCELTGNNEYDSGFNRKLGIYLSEGIIPGKNLIITWSYRDGALNLRQIERILKSYYE